MTDYLRAVIDMIGPPENRYADPAAWQRLETGLGLRFPADYTTVVDAYAPIQLNGHLYLHHPASPSWNLGQWIEETVQAFSAVDWDGLDLDADEDPRQLFGLPELAFGTPGGLWPLASTDRGETLFLVGGASGRDERFVIADGDGWWAEHRMPFAEWLYRYLIGEDMAGENSAVFYPGPVKRAYLPMAPGESTRVAYGPDRGM
ncbi:SMI1/KNR4 family protein [Streptomyces nanhaiensis]|uniref:SMI1/KNR4 family protein n=1 Tax=Streptomyces nanhaiensis TaxID=679319 RepID=UPI00399C5D22